MRPFFGALAFFLSVAVIEAQDPNLLKADPSASSNTAAQQAAPQLIPSVAPLPTIAPDASAPTPTGPAIQELDNAFKQTPLNAAAENSRLLFQWRELRNRLNGDPEVRQALAESEAARTDLEKRKLLGRYYEIYFGKMIARAATPDLKTYLQARENDQLRALLQPKVRPTPTPSPTPSPSPVSPPPEPPLPGEAATPSDSSPSPSSPSPSPNGHGEPL